METFVIGQTQASGDAFRPEDGSLLSNFLGMSQTMMAQNNLHHLLDHVMDESRHLMNAEKSTLYLIDKDAGELISYIGEKEERLQIHLPIGQGVAGHVCRTGDTIHLDDAYSSPLFDRSWDEKTGFRTHSMLCIPIVGSDGGIKGALQVINKRDGLFSKTDTLLLGIFARHAAASLDNVRLYEDLKLAFTSAMRALATAVDLRDPGTAGHSERVTTYAMRLANAMQVPTEQLLPFEHAAWLHDVGKIGIPDAVLCKPGQLTTEELEVMKSHASISRRILHRCYFPDSNVDIPFIAGAHHERLDGSGYPDGIGGNDLPLLARILAVADVYDAVTSFDRLYRKPMSEEEGLALITSDAGTKLDPEVVSIFKDKHLFDNNRHGSCKLGYGAYLSYQILRRDRQKLIDRFGAAVGRGSESTETRWKVIVSDFMPIDAFLNTLILVGGKSESCLAHVIHTERIGLTPEFEVTLGFLDASPFLLESLNHYLTPAS